MVVHFPPPFDIVRGGHFVGWSAKDGGVLLKFERTPYHTLFMNIKYPTVLGYCRSCVPFHSLLFFSYGEITIIGTNPIYKWPRKRVNNIDTRMPAPKQGVIIKEKQVTSGG